MNISEKSYRYIKNNAITNKSYSNKVYYTYILIISSYMNSIPAQLNILHPFCYDHFTKLQEKDTINHEILLRSFNDYFVENQINFNPQNS